MENKVANLLSHRVTLLTDLRYEIIGFEFLRDNYEGDEDFREIWKVPHNQPIEDFHISEGFLLKDNRLLSFLNLIA